MFEGAETTAAPRQRDECSLTHRTPTHDHCCRKFQGTTVRLQRIDAIAAGEMSVAQLAMNTKTLGPTSLHWQSDLLKCCTIVGTVGLVWIAGCSADTAKISNVLGCVAPALDAGAGGTGGGAAAGATAGDSTGGAAAGAANTDSGGSAQADTSQAMAGTATTTQGGAGQGGTSALTGTGGLVGGASAAATCPAYDATGGVLVTPPSNGFESDITDWTTMTGKSASLSRQQSATSACEGTWYLACDGASRSGPWDGPKFIILPYVVVGHQYAVTVAARFDPENAPAAAGTIIFSTVNACSDSSVATVFRNLQRATTLSDWVRLSGTVEPVLEGCSQLSEVTVYVESDSVDQPYSIDVNDFQLWDVTPATASDAAGAAGSSGQ